MATVLQAVALLFAGIGIPLAIYQVWSGRTAALIGRFSTSEFLEKLSKTLSFLTVRDADECVRKIQAYECRLHADDPCLPRSAARPGGPKPTVNELTEVLSFLEEFAAAYNRHHLARRVAHDTFPAQPVQFLTTGWWYVCWRRGGRWVGPKWARRIRLWFTSTEVSDRYVHWEWMVKQLRKRVPTLARGDFPRIKPFVLCLPPEAKREVDREWRRARRCSALLSRHVGNLAPALEALKAAAAGRRCRKPTWQVVMVPPSIDLGKEDVALLRYDAECLACYLTVLDQQEFEAAVVGLPAVAAPA